MSYRFAGVVNEVGFLYDLHLLPWLLKRITVAEPNFVGMVNHLLLPVMASSETQGQMVGPKTKIKTGGKKFDEQKYERKIRAPGDKLFMHQFQTAE